MREILLGFGDWLQSLAIVPSLYFVIDYGIVRPRLRVRDAHGALVILPNGKVQRRFQPWWDTRIGRMFFFLGVAFTASSLVVAASLTFGGDYPGREFARIFGYALSTSAVYLMAIVYTVERNTEDSLLVPPARD